MHQPIIVTIQTCDPGAYSREVVESLTQSIQKYLHQEESILPTRVIVIMSADMVTKSVLTPDNTESTGYSVDTRDLVVVTLNIPLASLRAPLMFKNTLQRLFSTQRKTLLTDTAKTFFY
jgi:hypothetical protein